MIAYYVLIAGALLLYAFLFKASESKILIVNEACGLQALEKKQAAYCVLVGITLFFMLSLSGEAVGTDRSNYHEMFDTLPEIYVQNYINTFPSTMFLVTEPVFFILSYALKNVGIGFQGFLVVVYAFWIFAVFRLIRMYSKDVMLSTIFFICVGMFFVSFSALRQTMAMSFVALAFPSLKKGKPVRYFSLILCAMICHTSAVIMAVAYFFRYIRLNRRGRILLLAGVVLAAAALALLMPAVLSRLSGAMRISGYVGDYQPANPLTLLIAVVYGVFVLIAERMSDKKEDDFLHNILFLILCMYIGIMISCYYYATLNRMAYYCMLFVPIYLGNAIREISDYRSRLVIKIISLFIMIAYMTITVPGSYLGVYDYHFVWEQRVVVSRDAEA